MTGFFAIIGAIWLMGAIGYIYMNRKTFLSLYSAFPNANVSLSSSEKRKMGDKLSLWLRGFGISFFIHVALIIIGLIAIVATHGHAPIIAVLGASILWLGASLVSSFSFGLFLMKRSL